MAVNEAKLFGEIFSILSRDAARTSNIECALAMWTYLEERGRPFKMSLMNCDDALKRLGLARQAGNGLWYKASNGEWFQES